jgi:hypothetical protein
MAAGQRTNATLVPEARNALDRLKYEAAAEVGITPPASGYWGDIPSRMNGAVGGAMVRKMIRLAEQQLSGGAVAPATAPGTTVETAGAINPNQVR